MPKGVVTITIDPESELGKALARLDRPEIIIICNGERYTVTPKEIEPQTAFDPDRLSDSLEKFAGLLTDQEADEWIAYVRGRATKARDERIGTGTSSHRRPGFYR